MVTLVLDVMTQPVIPALLICESEASLGYTVRLTPATHARMRAHPHSFLEDIS